MKYIPGFQFVVGNTPTRKGGSVLQQTNTPIIKDKLFEYGKTYKLYHIKRETNQYKYIFLTDHKTKFELIFNSVEEAETRIDRLIGV